MHFDGVDLSITNKNFFKRKKMHFFMLLVLATVLFAGCKPSPKSHDQNLTSIEDKQSEVNQVLPVAQQDLPATEKPVPQVQSLLPEEACTLEGYWTFFESFAGSPDVQKAYTSPKIELRNYTDNGNTISKVNKGKYDYFRIGLVDYQWVYLEPGKNESNYDRLQLEKLLKENTFRVDYRKAEFDDDDEIIKTFGEPGAYVFEFRDGCWNLTKDLR
jgi:hypothetical protein